MLNTEIKCDNLKGAPLGYAQALPENIRLGSKASSRENTLAYSYTKPAARKVLQH